MSVATSITSSFCTYCKKRNHCLSFANLPPHSIAKSCSSKLSLTIAITVASSHHHCISHFHNNATPCCIPSLFRSNIKPCHSSTSSPPVTQHILKVCIGLHSLHLHLHLHFHLMVQQHPVSTSYFTSTTCNFIITMFSSTYHLLHSTFAALLHSLCTNYHLPVQQFGISLPPLFSGFKRPAWGCS
jgi:hypothetical protein